MSFDVIGCAAEVQSCPVFETLVLEHLCSRIGAEAAFIVSCAPVQVSVVGMEEKALTKAMALPNDYVRELAPVQRVALSGRGVAVDTEVMGLHRVLSTSYFRDFAAPVGGRHSLLGYLRLRGGISGMVMLGRTSRGFSPRECDSLAEILAPLAVARASFAGPGRRSCPSEMTSLTPREREILDYLGLGYRNAEIAEACGTSPHTVRNQLVSIFGKLGATTRTEAVALAAGRL
jgi:DNA-binding CsgD family transcriptional regulator